MGLFDKLFGRKPKQNEGYVNGYPEQQGYSVEDGDEFEQLPDQGHYPQSGNDGQGYAQGQNPNYAQPVTLNNDNAANSDYALNRNTDNDSAQAQNPGYRLNVGAEEQQPGFESFEESVSEVQMPNAEQREEYLAKFRAEFMHHFPRSLDTVESHMQLPYMIGTAVDIAPVIEYASSNVYARFAEEPDKLSELSRAAVAKVAMALEKYIVSRDAQDFLVMLQRAHNDSLEKAWIVLDFYCRMLKSDYTANINMLHAMVSDQLISRSGNPAIKAQSESYEEVLAKCAKTASEDPDSPELPAMKKRLFEKLMALDSIYLVHDETFNNAFPYIGADGRLEIQTSADRASSLKDFLEKGGDSKVGITEYKKEEYEKLFTKLLHHGLTVIRLDNGLTPVEIDIDGLYDNGEKNLIEICNRFARGRFVSELQYGYRIKNLLPDGRESEDYRVLASAMLKARSEGYRALAGGLCYVFNIGGAKPGTTLYTSRAMETAAEIMKVMGIVDENTLIAPGDMAYEVFEGEISLRSVQKKSSTPDKGFVCAFTDRENAEKIHERFTAAGANDAIVVMTLGELCHACGGCAGFILDMSSYGLEIPCELFGKMSECVKTEGILVDGKTVG